MLRLDFDTLGDNLTERHVDLFVSHDWPKWASVFRLSAEAHGVRGRVVTLPLVIGPDLHIVTDLKSLQAVNGLLVDFDFEEFNFPLVVNSTDFTGPKPR